MPEDPAFVVWPSAQEDKICAESRGHAGSVNLQKLYLQFHIETFDTPGNIFPILF